MSDAAVSQAFLYYESINASLFPIPAGQKFGMIVDSFVENCSADPAQWERWSYENPNCNFGVVAGASRLIIVDIDIKSGRDEAWAEWCDLCKEWGIAPFNPHVTTPSGGWHAYFSIPPELDATRLRQPDARKGRVNVRAGNGFVVAAGSCFNERQYSFLTNDLPIPAPAALIHHCTRSPIKVTPQGVVKHGSRDRDDVVGLLVWLRDQGAFEAYEDWFQIGMALKIEYGDDGLELWQMTHDETVDDDTERSKWNSFATDPDANSITLASFMGRAHKLGWRGSVRKSTSSMFDGVAAIAAAAGATLSSSPRAMPLLDTQKTVAALGQSILDNFLAGTKDAPARPTDDEFPTVPDVLNNHPLFDQLRLAIERIVAMGEGGSKTFRQERVLSVLGVLHAVHPPTATELCHRLTALGAVISPGRLDSTIKNFEWKVRVEQNTATGFITDAKGNPASDNSDNVHVFIRERAIRLRFNAWKDQAEVSDKDRDDFGQLNDHIFGDLLMDAKNSHFNYHPSEGLFRRGLISNARRNMYDPLVEKLDALAVAWDGVPRLHDWLSYTCGTPADEYHTAVGRNLIGGLVRRARHPGCEHAETVIFISPTQGTGKTTLCKILALEKDWHTDSFKFDGSPQNTIPQLAGKWLIELSEMAGLAHKDVEHVKSFLSATNDNYTKKYEAFATDHPRRCCFVGTSNSKKPLQDSSGGRRFLPVHVTGEVATDWLRDHVEQIIGECAARESQGESFAIPRTVWESAALHQEAARTLSPVEELCQEWFDRPLAPYGHFITATDIGRAFKMAGQSAHARYAPHLDKLGWRDALLPVPGAGRRRVWVRHYGNALEECVRLLPSQNQTNGPVEMRPTGSPVLPAVPPPPY